MDYTNDHREKVAEFLTAAGIPTAVEAVNDKQMDTYFENNPLEEVKTEDVKPEDIKPEDVKPEDVKLEDVKPEDIKPEDSNLDELTKLKIENAVLEDRAKRKDEQVATDEPFVTPPELEVFLDKSLYDPEKKIFGGIELSDDMSITEHDEYQTQKSTHERAMGMIGKAKKEHQTGIDNQRDLATVRQNARDEFAKNNPGVDVDELVSTLQKEGLQFGEAHTINQIRQTKGETYNDRVVNWMKAQNEASAATLAATEKAAEIKAAADAVTAGTDVNNSDGGIIPATDVEKLMEKRYEDFTPEEITAGKAYVSKMVKNSTVGGV